MGVGLFAKAAAKKADAAPAKKKKSTTWLVGTTEESKKVSNSVSELVKLGAEAKTIEARMGQHKNIVKRFAERQFVGEFADLGVPPETPMLVQNSETGEKVTFVVQDRSGQYAVKPEQEAALVELLGEDAAQNVIYEQVTFGFNPTVLALPGVQEIVEKALVKAIKSLTESETLTEEQADELLSVDSKKSFKPGTLDRLGLLVGKDTTKMAQMLEIMGGSCTRYVKT